MAAARNSVSRGAFAAAALLFIRPDRDWRLASGLARLPSNGNAYLKILRESRPREPV